MARHRILFNMASVLVLLAVLVSLVSCASAPTQAPTQAPSQAPTQAPAAASPEKVYTIKASHGYPAGDFYINRFMNRFKELTEKYTEGRVKVDVYAAGQLYPTSKEIEAATMNNVQFIATPLVYCAAYIPWYGALETPLLFSGAEHYERFVNDPAIRKLAEEAWAKKGLKLLTIGVTYPGYYVWSMDKPITKMEDFQGLKIRTGAGMAEFVRGWGASGVLIETTEVITALQTGMVEAHIATPEWFNANKLWTICKYSWPKDSPWAAGISLDYNMPLKFWNELPQDIQQIIKDKVVPEVVALQRELTIQTMDDAFEAATANGTQFQGPDEAEKKRLLDALRPTIDKLAAEKWGPEASAVLEAVERTR